MFYFSSTGQAKHEHDGVSPFLKKKKICKIKSIKMTHTCLYLLWMLYSLAGATGTGIFAFDILSVTRTNPSDSVNWFEMRDLSIIF